MSIILQKLADRTVKYFELKRLVRKAIREVKGYGKVQDDTLKKLRKLSR